MLHSFMGLCYCTAICENNNFVYKHIQIIEIIYSINYKICTFVPNVNNLDIKIYNIYNLNTHKLIKYNTNII